MANQKIAENCGKLRPPPPPQWWTRVHTGDVGCPWEGGNCLEQGLAWGHAALPQQTGPCPPSHSPTGKEIKCDATDGGGGGGSGFASPAPPRQCINFKSKLRERTGCESIVSAKLWVCWHARVEQGFA